MTVRPCPSGVVTLVFTDLEGSSELYEEFGVAFEAVRDEHFRLLREALAHCDGYEVETAGDSLFAAFGNVSLAGQFAIEAQLAMARQAWPPEMGRIAMRLGMHTGEPFIGSDQGRPTYHGPVTNRTSRIQAAGHGGQILCSDATRALLARVLPASVEWLDCGVHRLKGVGEERIWQLCHPELPHDFPPLQTLQPRQVRLPLFPTQFLGRDPEVTRLKELLLAPATRLLLLLGPGGVGKTRLSVRVAEEVADRYFDGVWYVELERATNQQEMFARIAADMGLLEQPGESETEAVLRFLAGKELLLLLDNIEQIPDVAFALDSIRRAAPQVTCLASSRERLRLSGVQVFEVAPLTGPPARHSTAAQVGRSESVQFFVEQARLHVHEFAVTDANAAAVARLCRQLEGLPLALELAAAWVADMTPEEIADEIREHLDFLGVDHVNIPERQRTMRSSIDWSYNRLPPDEQEAFVALGAFVGGFSRAAAAAVCEQPRAQIIRLVRQLHERSLLTRYEVGREMRFGMLATIAAYARDQLQAHPEAASIRQRHAAYYCEVAREFARKFQARAPHEVETLRQFEARLDNVRAAMAWSLRAGDTRFTAVLGLALGLFLQRAGLYDEAVQRVESGLLAARRDNAPVPQTYAELLRLRASLHLDQFHHAEAHESACAALDAAATIAAAAESVRARAEALNMLGWVATDQAEFQAARQHLDAAVDNFKQVNDEVGLAKVHNNRGRAECKDEHGDKHLAAHHFHEALRLYRDHGDVRGLAEVLTNLGAVAYVQSNPEQAWKYYVEALQYERDLHHAFGVGRSLWNLGEVAESQGALEAAGRCFAASECLFSRVGSPHRDDAEAGLHRIRGQLTGERALAASSEALTAKSEDELVAWVLESGPLL